MDQKQRIDAFARLGERLTHILNHITTDEHERYRASIALAFHKNGWFTEREVKFALSYWAETLNKDTLEAFLEPYVYTNSPKKVGLILAGNIPLVGYQDILCTLLSGHHAVIKPSGSDTVLIQLMMELLVEVEPAAQGWFTIHQELMKEYDAVIATGSNNSARYFEQYFGKVPNIIRRNRTSIAVLDGTESEEEMQQLMEDALLYFGLGCRNVTKIYVPEDYDLNKIFAASVPFAYVMDNKKYANNYAYHRTLLMMQQKEVLENEVLLLTPSEEIFSPVSVLHYERYNDLNALNNTLQALEDDIQCRVSKKDVSFGMAQRPRLNEFADGVDTMKFLATL